MFEVSEFRINDETHYFVHVYYGVVDLQIKSGVILCRVRSEECLD